MALWLPALLRYSVVGQLGLLHIGKLYCRFLCYIYGYKDSTFINVINKSLTYIFLVFRSDVTRKSEKFDQT